MTVLAWGSHDVGAGGWLELRSPEGQPGPGLRDGPLTKLADGPGY